jgi:hypothetical protein
MIFEPRAIASIPGVRTPPTHGPLCGSLPIAQPPHKRSSVAIVVSLPALSVVSHILPNVRRKVIHPFSIVILIPILPELAINQFPTASAGVFPQSFIVRYYCVDGIHCHRIPSQIGTTVSFIRPPWLGLSANSHIHTCPRIEFDHYQQSLVHTPVLLLASTEALGFLPHSHTL